MLCAFVTYFIKLLLYYISETLSSCMKFQEAQHKRFNCVAKINVFKTIEDKNRHKVHEEWKRKPTLT